ncbi:hypothetical protein LF1_22700 [Rubripirellula obstinata]|uniref:Outer membrane lipoprotein-sorting protein n=2 Tax=Rubripirellula obstinata TaxID=406547 RepID=A0A5B1CK09_9BACT|nr:hypothetical protein LF1_22700 [Rubripirellula obstinata]
MKSDRHIPILMKPSVKLIMNRFTCFLFCLAVAVNAAAQSDAVNASDAEAETTQNQMEVRGTELTSDPAAKELLVRVIKHMVGGPAFDAMVRETVHVSQHDVVGVGSYEQAGGGTGCYHLQLSMHDGHGKHSLRQISDGRLAWTRNEIAGVVSLRRVDVARLDEWIRPDSRALGLPPRLLVGGWAELLLTLNNDYHVKLGSATLSEQKVLVITGNLKPEVRQTVLADSGRGEWPELYPTEIRVAIATQPDPKTGFGKWLPVRMEFRGDPILVPEKDGYTTSKNGPLITLIEIYSLRSIDPPPPERFRFENQNAEVDIINETDRYMRAYGVRLTESERRSLRR